MDEKNINYSAQEEGHPLPDHNQDDIKGLVEKNIELTEEVLRLTKKINSFVVWERVFGVLKIFLIVIPIIWGIIYLPPLLEQAFGIYRDLLSSGEIWHELSGGVKAAPSGLVNGIK